MKGPRPGRYEAFTRPLMRACWLWEGGGRHAAQVWCLSCWSCAYCISNTVSATVTLTAAAVELVIVARFHRESGGSQSNEGEGPWDRDKNGCRGER